MSAPFQCSRHAGIDGYRVAISGGAHVGFVKANRSWTKGRNGRRGVLVTWSARAKSDLEWSGSFATRKEAAESLLRSAASAANAGSAA